MHENENPSLAQLQVFLESSQEVHFQAEGRAEIYAAAKLPEAEPGRQEVAARPREEDDGPEPGASEYTVTRPTPVSIGKRRRPDPRGRPRH